MKHYFDIFILFSVFLRTSVEEDARFFLIAIKENVMKVLANQSTQIFSIQFLVRDNKF